MYLPLLLVLLANILLLDFCVGRLIENGIVAKCCPDHEGLIRYESEFKKTYGCISPQDRNESFNLNILQPLKIGRANSTVVYGFPEKCINATYTEVQLSEGVPESYCADKLLATGDESGFVIPGNGSVVVITCNDASAKSMLSMRTVAKCCSNGMFYDTKRHVCYADESRSVNLFEEFIREESSLLDIRYGIQNQCKYPKAIYDYTNDDYTFNMTENVLILKRDNKEFTLEPGSFCLDDSDKNVLIARGCRDKCDSGPCISKCCPDGHVYTFYPNCSRAYCAPSNVGLSVSLYDLSDDNEPRPVEPTGAVGIKHEIDCPKGKYREITEFPKGKTFLDVVSGDIYIPNFVHPIQSSYCLEVLENRCKNETETTLNLFICFPVIPEMIKENQKYHIYSYGLIISCIFLVATLIVYIALPQLRNLHGKTIMCHVIALLIAFSSLARVGWDSSNPPLCKTLAFTVYFGFLAAFSWLNIMCFDIWWTFGNIRTIQSIRKNKELKKFLMFSLYGWGLPTVFTVATYLFDEYDYPIWLDANMGAAECWFATNANKTPWLILFITPVALQIGVNCVLFVLTASHCNKIKSEIHRMQAGSMGERCKRRFMADKAKYSMNVKLFIVMGITWILEILSSVVDLPLEYWYFSDILNVLQGILIFCILVLKRKVFMLIKKRLGITQVDPRIRSDGTTLSTVNTSVEINPKKPSTAASALIK